MERRQLHSDLNFSNEQRLAAIIAAALIPALMFAIVNPYGWLLLVALTAVGYWLNRDLFRLLHLRGGARLALAGFFLQQLYYLYSLLGLALGIAIHFVQSPSSRPAESGKTSQGIER